MAKYILSDLFPGNYPISQLFGARPWYYIKFGFAGHEGVDWALPVGVSVLNPFNSGKILRAGWDSAYGYHVVVWDPVQLCAVWFCHLSQINVRVGQTVSRFAIVGRSGRTGNVTGAHLHVNFCETNAYGTRINTWNGYKGFRNILDPNLVGWRLSR